MGKKEKKVEVKELFLKLIQKTDTEISISF